MKIFSWMMLLLLAGSSCRFKQGSGNLVTERRSVGAFTGLYVSGDFDVEVNNSGTPGVQITADDNIIHDIRTEVSGGMLRIRLEKGFNPRDVHMSAKVTAPQLNELSVSASARIQILDRLLSDKRIELQASSAGKITGNIHAPAAKATASSGAAIELAGQTRELDVTVSSGGSVRALDLLSERTHAESSSGGNAKVHASVSLDASASSGGDIRYRGNPSVKVNKSSGGSVEKE